MSNKREQFNFDLTCDVIRDLQVNVIKFRSTDLQWLSNAVWILKIGPVVSDIGMGGALNSPPPPSQLCYGFDLSQARDKGMQMSERDLR